MVTNDGCQLDYDELTSEVCLKSENNKILGGVDGQHRYKSIEFMLDNKEIKGIERSILENKEQSIFPIGNLSKQQQRELFLEINGTPNKVKKGTQLRLMITTFNHYGLQFLNNNKEFLELTNFDEDQVLKKDERKIPYRFIL